MLKIFGCKGIFIEGMPLIITAVTRLPNMDCVDGHILIIRPFPGEAIFLPPQRTNYKYNGIPVAQLGDDFQEEKILKTQLSWSKNQLIAWLYQERKGGYIPEQTFDWEEVSTTELIIPLAVMFHSNPNARAGILSIRDGSNCRELIDFLNKIRALGLTIEGV